MERLNRNECNVYVGNVFMDVLTNIERISDQCSNVGVHIMSMYSSFAAADQHKYLEWLHKGKSEEYNGDYRKTREIYLGMLNNGYPD